MSMPVCRDHFDLPDLHQSELPEDQIQAVRQHIEYNDCWPRQQRLRRQENRQS